MRKIKKGQAFASHHVPLDERSDYPTGTYFAIMPRPVRRDTKPIAVVIPQCDPSEERLIKGPPGSGPVGGSSTATATDEDFSELLKEDFDDFDLRFAHIKGPFTITSPHLEELCRVEPEKDEGAHRVYAPDGTLIARIRRTPGRFFPWPRRVRWHLEVKRINEPPSLYSAPKGTLTAWVSFVVLSPLWAALALFGLLSALLGADDPWFLWDLPARAKWRTGLSGWGLDFRGVSNTYYLNTETMDVRVAYAQAIIHSWTAH
ncbi:hypothetical protein [Streptomyces sp. NBC_01497]|uniref:hypothetical protein n=1 Tax=Streptomyces sp. NBC_01497 TaxID=2903885 RepID=UPI002E305438|nr:hypothetical protein [Streptomyces sp. NBC_01497]